MKLNYSGSTNRGIEGNVCSVFLLALQVAKENPLQIPQRLLIFLKILCSKSINRSGALKYCKLVSSCKLEDNGSMREKFVTEQ